MAAAAMPIEELKKLSIAQAALASDELKEKKAKKAATPKVVQVRDGYTLNPRTNRQLKNGSRAQKKLAKELGAANPTPIDAKTPDDKPTLVRQPSGGDTLPAPMPQIPVPTAEAKKARKPSKISKEKLNELVAPLDAVVAEIDPDSDDVKALVDSLRQMIVKLKDMIDHTDIALPMYNKIKKRCAVLVEMLSAEELDPEDVTKELATAATAFGWN